MLGTAGNFVVTWSGHVTFSFAPMLSVNLVAVRSFNEAKDTPLGTIIISKFVAFSLRLFTFGMKNFQAETLPTRPWTALPCCSWSPQTGAGDLGKVARSGAVSPHQFF